MKYSLCIMGRVIIESHRMFRWRGRVETSCYYAGRQIVERQTSIDWRWALHSQSTPWGICPLHQPLKHRCRSSQPLWSSCLSVSTQFNDTIQYSWFTEISFMSHTTQNRSFRRCSSPKKSFISNTRYCKGASTLTRMNLYELIRERLCALFAKIVKTHCHEWFYHGRPRSIRVRLFNFPD